MTSISDNITSLLQDVMLLSITVNLHWHDLSIKERQMPAELAAACDWSRQMLIDSHPSVSDLLDMPLTNHAVSRLRERNLPDDAVYVVTMYGKFQWTRGAGIYTIGCKEIKKYLKEGLNLSKYLGVQVVCGADDAVITAYRNPKMCGRRVRGIRLNCFHGNNNRTFEENDDNN